MTAPSDRFAFVMPTYRFIASHVMYQVCEVLVPIWLVPFAVFPYSPLWITPSTLGVFHCANEALASVRNARLAKRSGFFQVAWDIGSSPWQCSENSSL